MNTCIRHNIAHLVIYNYHFNCSILVLYFRNCITAIYNCDLSIIDAANFIILKIVSNVQDQHLL